MACNTRTFQRGISDLMLYLCKFNSANTERGPTSMLPLSSGQEKGDMGALYLLGPSLGITTRLIQKTGAFIGRVTTWK